ncbi:MAG: hypothetical protein M1823_003192 [Watsoniomyces obsoletus]|nr:MAG: hypothetical protein M1823_003192 [Watsoniomyces obsoletus]
MGRRQHNTDFAIACCLIGLASCATIIRLFTRGFLQRQLRIDDGLALLATIFGIIEAPFHLDLISFIRCARSLQAQQIAGAPREYLEKIGADVAMSSEKSFRQGYVGSILYLIGVGVIKLAILTFLLRFLTAGPLRRATYVVITIVSMFIVASTLAFIFQCNPIRLAWSYENPGGKCSVDAMTLHVVSSVFHLTSDFVILALPLFMVMKLQSVSGSFSPSASSVPLQRFYVFERLFISSKSTAEPEA